MAILDNSRGKSIGRRVIKGELEQRWVIALVKALLEIASIQNTGSQEVIAEWVVDTNDLEVTGKTGNTEGTTLKILFNLIEKENKELISDTETQYQKNKREKKSSTDGNKLEKYKIDKPSTDGNKLEKYKIDKVQNSINFLKEYDLLEDLRPIYKINNNTGFWRFKLKLTTKVRQETKDKDIQENINYVREKMGFISNNLVTNTSNKTLSTNKSSERSNQNIERLLCCLNFQKQKEEFQKNTLDNRRGVFLVKAERTIQLWSLWRLTKLIGNFDNAEIIRTKIDFKVKFKFDNFWETFAPSIGLKGDIDRKTVIEKLTDYHKTKSVVIVIKEFDELPDKHFDNLCNFWDELFESIQNISKTNLEKRKLWFVIFLLSKESNHISGNNRETKNPIKLNFTEIKKAEVDNWLNENDYELQKSNFDVDKGHQIIELLDDDSNNPHSLIDDICSNVFKLKNGIFDVEHYWKNIA